MINTSRTAFYMIILVMVVESVSAFRRDPIPDIVYEAIPDARGWSLPLDLNVCDPDGPIHLEPGDDWPDFVMVAFPSMYQRGRRLRRRWFSGASGPEYINAIELTPGTCIYRFWMHVGGRGYGTAIWTYTEEPDAKYYRPRATRGRLTVEYTILTLTDWPGYNFESAWSNTRVVAYDF